MKFHIISRLTALIAVLASAQLASASVVVFNDTFDSGTGAFTVDIEWDEGSLVLNWELTAEEVAAEVR